MRNPVFRVLHTIQPDSGHAEPDCHNYGKNNSSWSVVMNRGLKTLKRTIIWGPDGNRQERQAQRRLDMNIAPRLVTLLVALLSFHTASAVQVPFENCLPENYIYTNLPAEKVQIQWIPLYVDAVFQLDDPNSLKVTVWGNVTGKVGTDALPAWNNETWDDPNQVLNGKILAVPDQSLGLATTLHTKVDVVTYEPFSNNTDFCQDLSPGTRTNGCPLGPVFNTTAIASWDELPSFNLSHNFSSAYAFTTFAPTFIIKYGDKAATPVGCISTTVTPSLGGIAWFLRFLPVIVLVLVGVATAFAGIFSPWGTSDVFHWTSNYGRDPDILRLVTPGFGDCLQYIQFIVLTGGLSLNYPGFYQPVVSNGAWSALMFNQSFVSESPPWNSLVDGLYVTNGTLGLQNVAQLVGMSQAEDVWAGMMIWLLVIIGAVLAVIQVGFLGRWLSRKINNTAEEDLRAKNLPFSVGNIIRLVFNYFLLPIVALSTFQLVIAAQSATILIVMAVVTIVALIGFAVWLMYFIATTRPRAHLFDDLPTVLLYGPLYNTYSDEAAAFALIPIILTFMRGIAVGAVQPSGIAQLVILAVCEVIQMLTLHAFRPFHSPTSMNAYHTGFSALRFVSVILMVTFSPTMGLTEAPKGWVGYAILLIHGCVLVFGFFLNALQTIIEVIARMCGAGGDDVRGQTRGGLSKIFGARQLRRRMSRRGAHSRQSQLSTSGMLAVYNNSQVEYGRVRSGSAGSMGVLLRHQRSSSALDNRSIDFAGGSTFTPTTPGEASTFSFLPSPGQATRPHPAADPYYRPPRARRQNGDETASSATEVHRGSVGSVDLSNKRLSQHAGLLHDDPEASASGRVTPGPAMYAPVFAPRADYSTREVDFYYGVRGPALNSEAPSRKLGTGPADPTSPVATATSWIKGLFGGKTKEKGKGFEVVRSARMPPAMKARGGDFGEDAPPEGIPVAMRNMRNGPIESDDEDSPQTRLEKQATGESTKRDSRESDVSRDDDEDTPRVSQSPPLLPDLDAGESFRVPSRPHSSKTSRHASQRTSQSVKIGPVPDLPRRSSKRNSMAERMSFNLVPPSEAGSQIYRDDGDRRQSQPSTRLPFDRSNSQKRLSGSSAGILDDASAAIGGESGDERPTSYGYVNQHNISRIDPSSDQRVDLLGSMAEVVDESRRKVSPSSTVSRKSR